MGRARTISASLAVLLAMFAAGASAQTPPRVEMPAPQPLSAEPKLSYPGNVTGLQSVVFKIVNGYRPITLDLYATPPSGAAKPAILWVHGGGWRQGTTRADPGYADWTQLLAGIAARGFVVAAVDYRLSGEAKFPAALQDVEDAVRWLRKNAAPYGIDPKHVAIWGASSGAHLAALAATACEDRSLDDKASDVSISPCVEAAVDWFGPTDFSLALKPPAPGNAPTSPSVIDDMEAFVGCRLAQCPQATLRAVNPISYVSAKSPAFLIMHGTADKTVSIADSNALDAALKAKGADVQMIAYPGLAHGFAGASPEQKQAILQTVIDFFQKKTKP
jgi:acetyl esterase/lipase